MRECRHPSPLSPAPLDVPGGSAIDPMHQALPRVGSSRASGARVTRSSDLFLRYACAMALSALALALSLEPLGHPHIGVRISLCSACLYAFCLDERVLCMRDRGSIDILHDVAWYGSGCFRGVLCALWTLVGVA